MINDELGVFRPEDFVADEDRVAHREGYVASIC